MVGWELSHAIVLSGHSHLKSWMRCRVGSNPVWHDRWSHRLDSAFEGVLQVLNSAQVTSSYKKKYHLSTFILFANSRFWQKCLGRQGIWAESFRIVWPEFPVSHQFIMYTSTRQVLWLVLGISQTWNFKVADNSSHFHKVSEVGHSMSIIHCVYVIYFVFIFGTLYPYWPISWFL